MQRQQHATPARKRSLTKSVFQQRTFQTVFILLGLSHLFELLLLSDITFLLVVIISIFQVSPSKELLVY